MAWPTLIQRVHEENEFSLTLDTQRPLPARELAVLIRKIDEEASSAEDFPEGYIVELVEQKIGSEELRFRIIGPGRKNSPSQIAERQTKAMESQARATWIAAGAGVVTAVVMVLSTSIVSGALNSTMDRLLQKYGGSSVQITDRHGKPTKIQKSEITRGRRNRLRRPVRQHADMIEEQGLLLAAAEQREEEVAGHFDRVNLTEWEFVSVRGIRYPAELAGDLHHLEGNLVVARAAVRRLGRGIALVIQSARPLGNL